MEITFFSETSALPLYVSGCIPLRSHNLVMRRRSVVDFNIRLSQETPSLTHSALRPVSEEQSMSFAVGNTGPVVRPGSSYADWYGLMLKWISEKYYRNEKQTEDFTPVHQRKNSLASVTIFENIHIKSYCFIFRNSLWTQVYFGYFLRNLFLRVVTVRRDTQFEIMCPSVFKI